jgi:hypothetical protein
MSTNHQSGQITNDLFKCIDRHLGAANLQDLTSLGLSSQLQSHVINVFVAILGLAVRLREASCRQQALLDRILLKLVQPAHLLTHQS